VTASLHGKYTSFTDINKTE
jgi:hypothetical protein